MFELESGNQNVDGQTGRRRTHQSNRWLGYMQPAQKEKLIFMNKMYRKISNVGPLHINLPNMIFLYFLS